MTPDMQKALRGGTYGFLDTATVSRLRAQEEAAAREAAQEIMDSVEALERVEALPRRQWRTVAHLLYNRHIYMRHIKPHERAFTLNEISDRLNRIGVPRFRGTTEWTPQAVAEVRKVVADMRHGEILLPAA